MLHLAAQKPMLHLAQKPSQLVQKPQQERRCQAQTLKVCAFPNRRDFQPPSRLALTTLHRSHFVRSALQQKLELKTERARPW